MKKIQISLVAISVFICANVFSQNATDLDQPNNEYLSSITVPIFTGEDKYAGSPYSNEKFQRGNVFKDGKLVANNVGLRYNVKKENIELKKDINSSNIVANVVSPSEDIYVKILNDIYVFFTSQSYEMRDGYYLVLHEGEKINLYKKEMKEFIEGKKSINTITRDISPSFKNREYLFVADSYKTLTKLSNSRKARFNIFPDSKKELKNYIKDKRLNISKEADYLKLIKYYNSL